MSYVEQTIKEEARRTNLVDYLKANHPESIIKKNKSQYAYKADPAITFFEGKDGVWHYCNHQLRLAKKTNYCGDSIQFLIDFIGGYTFATAVNDLYEFSQI